VLEEKFVFVAGGSKDAEAGNRLFEKERAKEGGQIKMVWWALASAPRCAGELRVKKRYSSDQRCGSEKKLGGGGWVGRTLDSKKERARPPPQH